MRAEPWRRPDSRNCTGGFRNSSIDDRERFLTLDTPPAKPAWHYSRLMKAVRREPVDCVPVWLMRQAGRYLPEYREIRRRMSFWQLCKSPQVCADVMLLTVERLGVDAAIVFSDLLTVLDAMGLEIEFTSGGPSLLHPIRSANEVDRLQEPSSLDRLHYVMEAVRRTRAGLPDHIPLIGFAGAPFTLAGYAIEGGGSRDFRHTKALMYSDPAAWDALMSRLARVAARYLAEQAAAGAQLVQLFDSWVGCLGPDDYRSFVLPYTRMCIESLPPGLPVIHFATGNPALLPLMRQAGGEVIGIDWRVRLDEAWRAVGYDRAVQGNLDPAVLLASPKTIRRRVAEILQQAGGRPGHIFNLGHGVLPQTPVENAQALVQAVHQLSQSGELASGG